MLLEKILVLTVRTSRLSKFLGKYFKLQSSGLLQHWLGFLWLQWMIRRPVTSHLVFWILDQLEAVFMSSRNLGSLQICIFRYFKQIKILRDSALWRPNITDVFTLHCTRPLGFFPYSRKFRKYNAPCSEASLKMCGMKRCAAIFLAIAAFLVFAGAAVFFYFGQFADESILDFHIYNRTLQIFAQYPVEITPAEWTFWTWTAVWGWQLLWLFYSLILMCRRHGPKVLTPFFLRFHHPSVRLHTRLGNAVGWGLRQQRAWIDCWNGCLSFRCARNRLS